MKDFAVAGQKVYSHLIGQNCSNENLAWVSANPCSLAMSCPMQANSSDPSDASANLSSARVQSSIPRSSLDDQEAPSSCPGRQDSVDSSIWMYPSEKMFYNAMARKGHNPREEDMKVVVNIHNMVNEQCWIEILKWEHEHWQYYLRFLGRPDDLSPKAWFKHWILGYKPPFDRHDWYIDRCGQKVRYILDFYGGSSDPDSTISFHLDVRPALDSWEAVKDRFKRFFFNSNKLS